VVDSLHTEGFPFHAQPQIETEVWKKAIINAVFNSVCPLLEADNGIFQRDPACAGLAREIVRECLGVARGLGLELGEAQVMEQLLVISKKSDGQQISTLQDLNHGRLTEIESLNLEIARLAARLEPPVPVHKTRLLGEMVRLKSELRRGWVNSAPSRMIWAEVHPQQQDH
jgi:2-dehydropantoate 2-reductase